jgi:hypothetical protein
MSNPARAAMIDAPSRETRPWTSVPSIVKKRRPLFPLVAKVLAAGFAHDELLEAFDGVFSGRNDTDESRQDLETRRRLATSCMRTVLSPSKVA